jgi:hypothetical protein
MAAMAEISIATTAVMTGALLTVRAHGGIAIITVMMIDSIDGDSGPTIAAINAAAMTAIITRRRTAIAKSV